MLMSSQENARKNHKIEIIIDPFNIWPILLIREITLVNKRR